MMAIGRPAGCTPKNSGRIASPREEFLPLNSTEARPQRYGGDTQSTARRYTMPTGVLRDIRKCCPIYGSQARVLQVATEILVRQKKPIRVRYTMNGKDGKEIARSIKLLPRTIQLIDRLTPLYGSHGKLFAVCVDILRDPA
jgi:hypothetical protein